MKTRGPKTFKYIAGLLNKQFNLAIKFKDDEIIVLKMSMSAFLNDRQNWVKRGSVLINDKFIMIKNCQAVEWLPSKNLFAVEFNGKLYIYEKY